MKHSALSLASLPQALEASPSRRPDLRRRIGDNLGDFTDACRGSIESAQNAFADNQAHWGKDRIAIPNRHGSWESTAFGHDFKMPPEEQRQKKLDALKTWSGPDQ